MKVAMRLLLALLLALPLAAETGGYGVSTLTVDGCHTQTGPGRSIITLGRGWNNGDLDLPVALKYTAHECNSATAAAVESVIDQLRRMLPLVTFARSTDVNAPLTLRVGSITWPSYLLGQANYSYSVEPVAGDVLINDSLTGTQLWRVVAHEIGHALGVRHGGSLMRPTYRDGPLAYESADQILFSEYYRVRPFRYFVSSGRR